MLNCKEDTVDKSHFVNDFYLLVLKICWVSSSHRLIKQETNIVQNPVVKVFHKSAVEYEGAHTSLSLHTVWEMITATK